MVVHQPNPRAATQGTRYKGEANKTRRHHLLAPFQNPVAVTESTAE